MEELLEYRQRMLEKVAKAGEQLEAAVSRIKDTSLPLETDGWNTHQLVAHMRDVNLQVYLPRLHRIVEEDNPQFENFDGEAWMADHYQPGEPIQKIVAEFGESCRSSAKWLAGLPVEAWNRSGRHLLIGKHSLQWWLERTLAHISEHLVQFEIKGG
jgi:hypothetical protein